MQTHVVFPGYPMSVSLPGPPYGEREIIPLPLLPTKWTKDHAKVPKDGLGAPGLSTPASPSAAKDLVQRDT